MSTVIVNDDAVIEFASKIAVSCGSGTRAAEWARLLTDDTVDRTQWDPMTIIVGQTFAGIDDLRHRCMRIGVDLKVGIPPDELARILARSCVALITGGM